MGQDSGFYRIRGYANEIPGIQTLKLTKNKHSLADR